MSVIRDDLDEPPIGLGNVRLYFEDRLNGSIRTRLRSDLDSLATDIAGLGSVFCVHGRLHPLVETLAPILFALQGMCVPPGYFRREIWV